MIGNILKNLVQTFYLNIFFLFVLCIGQVFGQFGYEKFDDDPYTEYKPIDFFSQPYYNRVEGVVLHGGVFLRQVPVLPIVTSVELAFATRTNSWHYNFGLQQWLFTNRRRMLLRLNFFQETRTNDSWKIGRMENSLAGVFMHEDFHNHYAVKGFSIAADQKVFRRNLLRIIYSQHRYSSMPVNTSFAGSLFDWSKSYAPNPAITEGDEHSVQVRMLIDERDNAFFPTSGFYFEGVYERTFGDFETNGIFINSVIYYPTINTQKFILVGNLGLRKGSLARQHLMTIGGIGSLRAFPDNYHIGQNLVMYRIVYHFGGYFFQKSPFKYMPTSDAASFAVFWESGNAWYADKPKRRIYHGIFKPQLLGDAGMSLLLADGILRVDIARQLLNGDGDWRLTFRLFNKL